jgi:hypothetical protein
MDKHRKPAAPDACIGKPKRIDDLDINPADKKGKKQ